ncbi:MAG: hemolysin activation/secretion protein [Rhodothermales bacterium]
MLSAAQQPISGVIKRSIDEDSSPRAFFLVLQAQDADGDAVQWTIAEQGAHGQAAVEGGGTKTISYVPEADWNGVDRFTIAIADGLGGFSTLAVEVTVAPQNDPPVSAGAPVIAGLGEIGETVTVSRGSWNDSRDGKSGNFNYSYQWHKSTALGGAAMLIEGATGVSYVIADGDDGAYLSCVVTAIDGDLSTSAASNIFKVGNAAPTFVLVTPDVEPVLPSVPPEPTVQVAGINIVGNDSIPSEELQPLVADVVDTEVTLTQLKAAADKVTAEYRKRGMTLAKAYLPAQEMDNGQVTLKVLEGKVGKVSVDGNRIFSDEFVLGHLEAAMSGTAISNQQLERGLLILNEDYTGIKVQTVLKPGEEQGTVDIEAKVEEDKQWRGRVGYNNFGSDFVSPHRFTLGADANSLITDGDLLTLQGVFGDVPSDLAHGAISYSLPLNRHGTQIGLRLSGGSFEVSQEFADLGLEGDNVSGSFYMSHPLIKSRDLRVSAEAGFQAKDANFEILGQTTSADRTRALYASVNASANYWGGSSHAIANFTQGLGQFAGGMGPDAESASRVGADNHFSRFTLSLARYQPVCSGAALLFRLGGQLASDSLVAAEEWQIGGGDSVRGYSPGESTGDQGVSASLELQISPWVGKPYSFVAFVDHAYAYRDSTFVSESSDTDLTGAGFGLRLEHVHRDVTGALRLDLGWPIGSEDNSNGDEPVLYLSTELQF